MGSSFEAVSDDASGVFWNTAGLGDLSFPELSFTHLNWLADSAYESLSYVQPVPDLGVLGAGFSLFHIPQYDNTAGADQPFSTYSYQGLLSYNRALQNPLIPELFGGLALKYISTVFGDLAQLNNLAIDLHFYHVSAWKPLHLGLSLQNLGISSNALDPLPFTTRFGLALYFDNLLFSAEGDQVTGQNAQYHAGAEYWIQNILGLRGGYETEDATGSFSGFAFGVGTRFAFYQMDYSVASLGDLGYVQRGSLQVSFASAPGQTETFRPVQPTFTPTRRPTPLPPTATPTPEQSQEPAGTPTPVHTRTLHHAKAPAEPVLFPPQTINASVDGMTITLTWEAPAVKQEPIFGYDVYFSMSPSGPFRKLTFDPVIRSPWSTTMGTRGMTYYFAIKTVGANGDASELSEVQPVLIP